jgi:hypothetical protein
LHYIKGKEIYSEKREGIERKIRYKIEENKKIQKNEKKFKKGVDKWEIVWYYSGALLRETRNETRKRAHMKRASKKVQKM